MKKYILSTIFFILTFISTTAQQFVNDQANFFTEEEKAKLNQKLSAYEQKTTTEIVVYTIETLNGELLEEYSLKLTNKLGVGKVDKDNGVLILLSRKERKVRIELGFGTNEYMSNAQAKIILDQQMIPNFKQGKFYTGVDLAIDKIAELLGDVFND